VTEPVLCHSGFEYAERPVALYWEGQHLEICEILGRWRTQGGKRFRVLTRDDQIFELFYDESSKIWRIKEM
jgi:hypothetical protein